MGTVNLPKVEQIIKKRKFVIKDEGRPYIPGIMLATIIALKELGGSGTVKEIDERIIETENIGETEQSLVTPSNNRSKLKYYLRWGRTYLGLGGALENSTRGVWSLTKLGFEIDTLEETEELRKKVDSRERAKKRDKKKETTNVVDNDESLSNETANPDNDDWKTTLLETLGSIKPRAFERLSQRLLREAGFVKVEVLGKVADGGIDGIGILLIKLISFHVYFQCKRWKGSVGSKEIRDFRGALQGRADKGLFITTGSFTSSAKKEATRDGAIAIDLIDGDMLCDLLKENNLGVQTELVEHVSITPEWFDRFNIEPPKNQKPKPKKTKKETQK